MRPPVSFYIGEVGHRRSGPIRHSLRYRVAYVLLDVDQLNRPRRLNRLFGLGRRALLSVHPRDHGPGDADDLAGWVRALLAREGVGRSAARIALLTMPRMIGYAFNPLSVYFIRDESDALHHILYEVTNTFGERHIYLCATAEGRDGAIEQSAPKTFYVSPFFEVSGSYQFSVRPADDDVAVTIQYTDAENRPALSAWLTARRAPMTVGRCALVVLQFPLMTIGVIAAIHWEALKLLLKGARYRRRDPRSHEISVTYRSQTSAPRDVPPAQRDAA